MLVHTTNDTSLLLRYTATSSQERTPELEVHGLDGEAILLIQLTCQLQAEVRLPRCTLGTHLGSSLCGHVRHVEDIPQQAAFCMVPAGQTLVLNNNLKRVQYTSIN